MPDPIIPTFDRPLPKVDQPTFVNRVTLCPVCLKPCDLQVQDIVPYFPDYLAPFDTLRAYDGFYHRACLYQVGDYERMVVAWYQGERARAEQQKGVVAFERDIAALKRRTLSAPLELLLFPRFARFSIDGVATLDQFTKLLSTYHRSSRKRSRKFRAAAMEIRPVANQELMVFRWEIPLRGILGFNAPPRLPSEIVDLQSLGLEPGALHWRGGDLEPGIQWDLRAITGRLSEFLPGRVVPPYTSPRQPDGAIAVHTHRLRFIPIWDDEVAQLVEFLGKHKAAIAAAL
ncbi:MAG TPA: hypothetical protein VEI97_11380 [bacterium]|nr:hypothetical protein [bacterium]